MSVVLPDSAARAVNRFVNRRVAEMDPDHVLAVALGEIKDEEFDAIRSIRRALHEPTRSRSTRPSVNGNGRSIAVGRYAFDYLKSSKSLEDRVVDVLKAAQPRKTLVGISVPDADTAKTLAATLRAGADESDSSLTKSRLETAAERMEKLAKTL